MSTALERHFTISELAERWGVSAMFVEGFFKNKHSATVEQEDWHALFLLRVSAIEKAERRWQRFSGSPKCYICGFPVRLSLPRYHPLELNRDHIVCVRDGGKGGDNLRPSHRVCNLKRGVCDVDEVKVRECRERVISEYLR